MTDTSPAALSKLAEALKSQQQADMDGTFVKVSRQACDEAAELLLFISAEKEAQLHPEQPLEMVAPADVPPPAPTRYFGHSLLSPMYTSEEMLEHREAYAKAAVAAEREMREALELIAAPKRPDGTWNRDREACRQLAAEALGRYNEKQKGM